MDADILKIFRNSSNEKHFAPNTYSEIPRNKTDLNITSGQNANWTYANFFVQNDHDKVNSYRINEGQYVILKENGTWRLYDFQKNKIAEGLNEIETFVNKVVNAERKWRDCLRGTSDVNSLSNINSENNSSKITLKGYSQFANAIRTKPFLLLAGISGTGKSRIVRKLAQASITEELQKMYDPKSVEKGFNRWGLHKPANFELVQVKPNWHNSMEVIGYKSNIGGAHYEYTPFVEFVVKAWKHQDIPFFLCLDEMNLAPVEQYFAEFLSAIESRSIENDEYETDPIIKPFMDFGDEVCTQMINHLVGKVDASNVVPDSIEAKLVERFKTKGLTLPKNLFVLGTVNMDETTFSFSRKVLDRAMSIVMNDVSYDKFFTGETENNMSEFDDRIKSLLINRPIRGLEAEDNDAEVVEQYLTAVNEILNNTPFKLGYRAANEALLYVSAAHHFDASVDANSALDEFTLMKILSRIEGDKRSIGNLLIELQQVINERYPASNKKLVQMAETLQNKQFVSYWT